MVYHLNKCGVFWKVCVGGKMNRTLIPLDITTSKIRKKKNAPLEDLETDFIEMCKYVMSLDEKNRKKDFEKAQKIMYMSKFEYYSETSSAFLVFNSARYAKSRKVINTKTLEDRGVLKGIDDGDEEKTHIAIKFDWGEDRAVCIFEKNSDGIGVTQLFDYLNDFIFKYHDVKEDYVYYVLVYSNIVSDEFLEELEKAKRIKAVTLTVNQEDISVSEIKAFADRDDISQDVDICLKPCGRGKGITGNTVKEFYRMYHDAHKKVKRITIKAENEDSNPVSFDTEKIKAKEIVDVAVTINGEVKEFSIKSKLMKALEKY